VEEDGSEVDVRGSIGGIFAENLLVQRDGALLFAGFFGLDSSEKQVLGARCGRRATAMEEFGCPFGTVAGDAVEIKEELAADRVEDRALRAEREARAIADEAGFEKGVGHAGNSFHGHDGVSDGSGRYGFFAEGADGAQLAEVLEGIGVLLRNESGSFPSHKLAGTNLQDSQNILAAIAVHSSMLPC